MKTPEDRLFRILMPFDGSGWNALACIAAFMADNKLHAMYTTEQELSGEYSPDIIMYRFHCYVYILCSLCGWSLEIRISQC